MFVVTSLDHQDLKDQGVRKESVEIQVTFRATHRVRATLTVTLAKPLTKERSSAGSLRIWTTPMSL